MRLTEILKEDQDLNNFIAKTKQVKNSLITGANAGAFSLLLKQIVTELDAPLILVEENENKAQNLYGELSAILPDDSVKIFLSLSKFVRSRQFILLHKRQSVQQMS